MGDWKRQLKQLWQSRKERDLSGSPESSRTNKRSNDSRSAMSEPLWQPRGAKPESAPRSIIIGLDFGTAFTKVVVGRQPGHVAIPFENTSTNNQYLVLSSFVEQADGICLLSAEPGHNETLHTNLKMPLLGDAPEDAAITAAIVFVALTLRHTRNWILRQYEQAYRDNWLNWHLNLGVATENYHDNAVIDVFKKIAYAAWAVSILPGDITMDTCRSILTQLRADKKNPLPAEYAQYENRLIHRDNFETIPEIVAQIASYTNSPQRRDDLHMLIDVGAGTLDIVLFIVGDEEFPIMAKAVHPIGAEMLRRHRLQLVDRTNGTSTSKPTLHMHSTDAFAEHHGIDLAQLIEHDIPFQRQVGQAILKPIQQVKKHRYPNSSRWHKEGVTTFVVGGGSHVDLYSDLIDRRFACMPKTMLCRRHPLPVADDLDAPNLDDDDAQRLSVAYGLSFDPFNLNEIIRADEIPNQEVQAVKSIESNYIGKEAT